MANIIVSILFEFTVMENSQVVFKWILNNISTLDASITEFTWCKKIWPHSTDIEIELKLDGDKYIGRGFSFNYNHALVKSFSEVCERYTKTVKNIKKISGVAVHSDYALACQNAMFEAIERDVFFCHFFTKTPGTIVQKNQLSFTNLFVLDFLSKQNIEIVLVELSTIDKVKTVVSIAIGNNSEKKFGIILGLGSSLQLDDAIHKALVECLRNVTGYLNSDVFFNEKIDFGPKVLVNNICYGLKLSAIDSISFFFKNSDKKIFGPLINVHFQEYQVFLGRKKPPVILAVLNCDYLIDFVSDYGQLTDKHIKRLHYFLGNSNNIDLNKFPVSLG